MRRHKWIALTIKEPFPVFYSHISRPKERRPETAEGPFYSAGSLWFTPYSEQNVQHADFQVQHLEKDGFTASYEIVER